MRTATCEPGQRGGVQGSKLFGLVSHVDGDSTRQCLDVMRSPAVHSFFPCAVCAAFKYSLLFLSCRLSSPPPRISQTSRTNMASNIFAHHPVGPWAPVAPPQPAGPHGEAPPGFDKDYDEITTTRTRFRRFAGGYKRYVTSDSLRTFPDNDEGTCSPFPTRKMILTHMFQSHFEPS